MWSYCSDLILYVSITMISESDWTKRNYKLGSCFSFCRLQIRRYILVSVQQSWFLSMLFQLSFDEAIVIPYAIGTIINETCIKMAWYGMCIVVD